MPALSRDIYKNPSSECYLTARLLVEQIKSETLLNHNLEEELEFSAGHLAVGWSLHMGDYIVLPKDRLQIYS